MVINSRHNKMKNPRSIPSDTMAFTLMELLSVMAIIIVIAGLASSAFKGGSTSDGTRSASEMLSRMFGYARTEAIMRQTRSRVVVDTHYDTAAPLNCYRRVSVAYLSPSNADPSQAASWKQVGKWEVLASKNFFDPNYSNPHGKDMKLTAPFGNSAGSYWYYAFLPNGQTDNTASQSSAGSSTPVQAFVSPGRVDASGKFIERNTVTPVAALYGFALLRMGNTAFFRDIEAIQKP